MTYPQRWRRGLAVLLAPFALTSCLVSPTTFNATLDIRADRSFTFTYVGEVLAMDDKDLGKGLTPDADAEDSGEPAEAAPRKSTAPEAKPADADGDAARLEALAKALSQEYGYRSARYIGNHRLAIDYAISGRLDRTFIFPFNLDGEIVIPFLAVEPRGKDRVRVKAPAFANERSGTDPLGVGSGSGRDSPGDALDGTFTLTTDGEIVSQNQEDGATALPGGRKRIVWRVTPTLRDAPTAVLKLAPLP